MDEKPINGMKKRFIKIIADKTFFAVQTLTKEDLVRVKEGYYDSILDLELGTWYNPENNTWEFVEGVNDEDKL